MLVCQYAGLSLQNKRKTNMDSLGIKEREICGQKVCMVVLCDGVGSVADGAYASARAVKKLCQWLDGVESTQQLGLRLRDEVLHVNKQIIEAAGEGGIQTATTLSALLIEEHKYSIVHVGDSRIYALQDEKLEQLTHDQVHDGKLTSCLGRLSEPEIFYNEGLIGEQKFLVCSDGLYKKTDIEQIRQGLLRMNAKNVKKCAEKLSQYAIECGETDNISIALMICESKR